MIYDVNSSLYKSFLVAGGGSKGGNQCVPVAAQPLRAAQRFAASAAAC